MRTYEWKWVFGTNYAWLLVIDLSYQQTGIELMMFHLSGSDMQLDYPDPGCNYYFSYDSFVFQVISDLLYCVYISFEVQLSRPPLISSIFFVFLDQPFFLLINLFFKLNFPICLIGLFFIFIGKYFQNKNK